MSMIARLKRLESALGKEPPTPWLIYERKPSVPDEDQREAAIADYKASHPDWTRHEFNFIVVVSDECKRLTERLLAGDRTGA